mmetsp:Transcript_15448/g.25531  ORF Transcript_15448/g.25531 Transcript_15448/m.25531 type:complete len:463 (-) Transcript_15448:542-1930(-)|eukprot:CAMPEP_0184657434 /NCGR_PEP_ID=MMETSP0308-20130426/19558_1 /TAXON_ID=38269 /ORGANISM="Gloeochaete witrockiana, Strain SAG 46.84" /LENGTH=462 /DNA_ID=CAMNT_0027095265 /DNA_START=12 /DNA_END=1400 /DNA_ORIENTATION=-
MAAAFASQYTDVDRLILLARDIPEKLNQTIIKADWTQVLPKPESIQSFEWSFDTTPLAKFEILPSVWALYYGTLITLWVITRIIKPVFVKPFMALHNLLLCLLSLAMFAGLLHSMIEEVQANGHLACLFCQSPAKAGKGPLFYWLYIFYLSKFYELIDTVFLVLLRKELTFLHVYHHSVVLLQVYAWSYYKHIFAVWGMLFNCGVHVFMYFYYFLSACGVKPKWGRGITNAQIVQFATSFLLMFPLYGLHFHDLAFDSFEVLPEVIPVWPWLVSIVRAFKYKPQCAGMEATFLSVIFNATFLGLFINFSWKKYEKPEADAIRARMKARREAQSRNKGAAAMMTLPIVPNVVPNGQAASKKKQPKDAKESDVDSSKETKDFKKEKSRATSPPDVRARPAAPETTPAGASASDIQNLTALISSLANEMKSLREDVNDIKQTGEFSKLSKQAKVFQKMQQESGGD